jgi:hypothetical protein
VGRLSKDWTLTIGGKLQLFFKHKLSANSAFAKIRDINFGGYQLQVRGRRNGSRGYLLPGQRLQGAEAAVFTDMLLERGFTPHETGKTGGWKKESDK